MHCSIIKCFEIVSEKSKNQSKKDGEKTKEEPSSVFQRQRVDMLLGELLRKFPPPVINPNPLPPADQTADGVTIKQEVAEEVKPINENNKNADDFKSPEKKIKLG